MTLWIQAVVLHVTPYFKHHLEDLFFPRHLFSLPQGWTIIVIPGDYTKAW